MQFSATLRWHSQSLSLLALVDSGADENFIDSTVASQAGISLEPLPSPLQANALTGRLLAQVSHRTVLVHLIVSGNHHEHIQFHVISSPLAPIVLGQPWLRLHNPHIDWAAGKVVSWSSYCLATCLRSARSPSEGTSSPVICEPPDLSGVPTVYHDLGEVFSKQRALSLPPHRPYDCAIRLRPGAPLPSSRLYNVSRPERESMEKESRQKEKAKKKYFHFAFVSRFHGWKNSNDFTALS